MYEWTIYFNAESQSLRKLNEARGHKSKIAPDTFEHTLTMFSFMSEEELFPENTMNDRKASIDGDALVSNWEDDKALKYKIQIKYANLRKSKF